MTSRDFCYWLQGKFELDEPVSDQDEGGWTPQQVDIVKRHLAMVFKHEIDPAMGSKEHQGKLSAIHNGQVDCDSFLTNPKSTADIKYRC